ncbi:hypothetical protein L6164_023515 [Bauhinia variegata]|uniref:Uncharacterized protein n=1 Tax=Bauhinia variegata TaxID=167791 RepID=A0ACB9MKD4_BAUVA|nr:hypothetical protein L6164_023515 [Bauhinia variegata]
MKSVKDEVVERSYLFMEKPNARHVMKLCKPKHLGDDVCNVSDALDKGATVLLNIWKTKLIAICHSHRQEGLDGGTIAGISGGVAALLFFVVCIFVGYYWRKKRGYEEMLSAQDIKDTTSSNIEYETFGSGGPVAGGATGITSIMVDKSVEFLYEELANATDNFSVANKIGQRDFGAIYYGDLRGEKVAIKKMEIKASKEFIAEVKVLMNVHHLIVLVSSTNVLVCYIFDPRGLLSIVYQKREHFLYFTDIVHYFGFTSLHTFKLHFEVPKVQLERRVLEYTILGVCSVCRYVNG